MGRESAWQVTEKLFFAGQKQILRFSTPATAKTAVAGDPGYHPSNGKNGRRRGPRLAQDDTSQSLPDTLILNPL
jgi:hypothetical protein